MRILGLDLGERRVGVALSDLLGMTAQPLCTLEVTGPRMMVERIVSLVTEHEVERIVVGLPLNQDGTQGPRAERTRELVGLLQAQLDLPVDYVDERFSSREAQRVLSQAPAKVRRDKTAIDRIAASLILQQYLDTPH